MKKVWLATVIALLGLTLAAAPETAAPAPLQRLAVATPQVKAKALSVDEVGGLADLLETRIGGDYELVSRAALPSMLQELDFQSGSGLVMSEQQRAQFGEIKGVDCLLVSTISKIAGRLYLSLAVLDANTGSIRRKQRVTISGTNLEDLIKHIDSAIEQMGLAMPQPEGEKPLLAVFEFKLDGVKADFPLAKNLTTKVENALLKQKGFELLTRQQLDDIVRESGMVDNPLAALDQYRKIGELAVAGYVLTGTVTRFEFEELEVSNALTGGVPSKRQLWKAAVDVRILRVEDGRVMAGDTVEITLRQSDIPVLDRRDWTRRDWENTLLDRIAVRLAEVAGSLL